MARKTRRKSVADEVADVVCGRTNLSLEKLVELIGRVNPTERGLPLREADDRYRLKSQLQSLLIRQHGTLVQVFRVDDVTIALSLEGTGRHAAHARLDMLDDDARSWVQHRLDVPTDVRVDAEPRTPRHTVANREPSVAPQLDEDAPVHDLLKSGAEALDAYDYEAARSHYEAAASSSGSLEAHARLLELLVNNLVADADALAWEARLPTEHRDVPRLRLVLGIAHARGGSPERAGELLNGVELPDAALGWVELASRLLSRGDEADAARAVETARRLDPTVAGLMRVASELEHRQAAAMAVAERDLETLVEAGAGEEALRERATAVLAKFPTSRRAGAVLREIAGAAQEKARTALVTHAQQLVARASTLTEIDAAIETSRAAERAGANMTAMLAALRAKRGALTTELEVVALAAALSRGQPDEATLMRWVEAPTEVRARVLGRTNGAVLKWLAAIDVSRSSDARRAVRAVLGLARAYERYRAGHPAEAQSILDVHWSVLRSLPAAAELSEQLAAEADREICGTVKRALDLLEQPDLAGAERLLSSIDRRACLSPKAREQLALAENVLDTLKQRWSRGDAMAAAVGREDYFEARRLAREELAGASPEYAAQVEPALVRFEEMLRHQHSLLSAEAPGTLLDGRDLSSEERAAVLVDDDGQRAVVASFYASWVVLRVLQLDPARPLTRPAGRLVRGFSFNTRRLLDTASIHLTDDAIVIVMNDGERVGVTWDGSALGDRIAAPRGLTGKPANASMMPGGAALLVQTSVGPRAEDFVLHVVNAGNGRVTSKAPGYGWLAMHPGARGGRMWGATDNTIRRLDENGQPIGPELRVSGRIAHFLAADEDDGLWVSWVDGASLSRLGPHLGRFDPNQKLRAELVLPEARAGTDSDLAGVRGGCFVLAHGPDAVSRVWAVRDHGTSLEVVWAIDVPARGVLASSSIAEGAWLLVCSNPLEMWQLSLEAPPPLAGATPERDEMVTPSPTVFGARRAALDPDVEQRVRRSTSELGQIDPGSDPLGRLRARLTSDDDADRLRADALFVASRLPDHALACFARAVSLAPGRADIVRDYAQLLVATGHYADAARVAQGALALETPDAVACALPFAAARYALGDPQAARAALEYALPRLPDHHGDRPVIESFKQLLDQAFGSGSERHRVGKRARALRQALELRAAGDLQGAIAAADVADVWRPRDHAALAILSDLWLAHEPKSAAERLRRRLVLLAFAGATTRPFAPLVLEGRPVENLAEAQDRARRCIDSGGV